MSEPTSTIVYFVVIIGIPLGCYILARLVTSAYFASKVDFIKKFKTEGDGNGEENQDWGKVTQERWAEKGKRQVQI